MGHELSPRRLGRLLLEFVSLSTPRAVVVTLSSIIAVLALWPSDGLQYLPVRSVWVYVFHVEPYSTGITRALNHLLHGDVRAAWGFNRLVVVVFPLILGLIAVNAVRWRRGMQRSV